MVAVYKYNIYVFIVSKIFLRNEVTRETVVEFIFCMLPTCTHAFTSDTTLNVHTHICTDTVQYVYAHGHIHKEEIYQS